MSSSVNCSRNRLHKFSPVKTLHVIGVLKYIAAFAIAHYSR